MTPNNTSNGDPSGKDCAVILAAGSFAAAFGAVIGLAGIPDPYATMLMIIFAAAFAVVIWRRC